MKKFIYLSLSILLFSLSFSQLSYAHDLVSFGSESEGYKYVGAHWPSKTTYYFEATTDTWESRFKAGEDKFEAETTSLVINKAAVGSTENFIENYSCSSCEWVAQRSFYATSNDHPTRWRIQLNSGLVANSWTTVAAHEIGHVFGLDDLYNLSNDNKLMFGYDDGVRYVQPVESAAFIKIY